MGKGGTCPNYIHKVHQLGEMGWPALVSKAQTHLYITFNQINPVFPKETAGVAYYSPPPLMIIRPSGDCFSPSATSQIGLALCPSHASLGCLTAGDIGLLATSSPQIQRIPFAWGLSWPNGVQEHRGCGLGGWEGISGAQPEHPW